MLVVNNVFRHFMTHSTAAAHEVNLNDVVALANHPPFGISTTAVGSSYVAAHLCQRCRRQARRLSLGQSQQGP